MRAGATPCSGMNRRNARPADATAVIAFWPKSVAMRTDVVEIDVEHEQPFLGLPARIGGDAAVGQRAEALGGDARREPLRGGGIEIRGLNSTARIPRRDEHAGARRQAVEQIIHVRRMLAIMAMT